MEPALGTPKGQYSSNQINGVVCFLAHGDHSVIARGVAMDKKFRITKLFVERHIDNRLSEIFLKYKPTKIEHKVFLDEMSKLIVELVSLIQEVYPDRFIKIKQKQNENGCSLCQRASYVRLSLLEAQLIFSHIVDEKPEKIALLKKVDDFFEDGKKETCPFYNNAKKTCLIYEIRPVCCRLLIDSSPFVLRDKNESSFDMPSEIQYLWHQVVIHMTKEIESFINCRIAYFLKNAFESKSSMDSWSNGTANPSGLFEDWYILYTEIQK